ncbi:MAG: organic solvent tolerance protein [Ignavibacteriae bacterium]|nr:MAG: organic solvent tolerance protein [Ignavibacteriota bacterium]
MKNIILILLLGFIVLNAQENNLDSLQTNAVLQDSSLISISDSTKKKNNDIDAVVVSTAKDSICFDLKNKKMYIYGNGELKYKQTDLTGGKISVNFKTSDLESEGVIRKNDTTNVDELVETPKLTEAGENYEGTSLKYNFKTQRGFISAAKNKKQDQRYEGSAVKKVNKNTFFIKDGLYTTCKSDTPHTHFTAKEMKVIQKDKIFAKWIFMYIGGVPLPIPIPFAVFPIQKGRRSGIIAPTYGEINNRGHYFKHFGYFFAISNYLDLTLTGDYYTRGGWRAYGRIRYAKRYDFNGSINGSYSKILIGEDNDPTFAKTTDWNLNVNHNQTFTPTLRLDVSLNFQSSTYLRNTSTNYNDLLTKAITSNATLSKRWEESGNSLTINYSRTQILDSVNIKEVLPNINFNKSRFYPFKTSESSRNESWYEKIGMNYSAQIKNNRTNLNGKVTNRAGARHNISMNVSPQIGYFNISPSLSYVEKWYNKKTKRVLSSVQESNSLAALHALKNSMAVNSYTEKDVDDFNIIRTFNFGVSASTKLYGMMQPEIFGIQAFRHTLTPRVSYNYHPDFSGKKWGYYESYINEDGIEEWYDPYGKEIYGGAGSGESQSLSFALGNVFEMKTMKDPTDTTSKSKKITLLNLDLSTGYNFAAEKNKLSDLRINYRTNIGQLLNFSGSSSYTFYNFDNNGRTNTYLASLKKGLFRITNFNFSISTSLSAEKIMGEERTGKKKEDKEEFKALKKDDYQNVNDYNDEDVDFSIPWNLSLSYRYNFSKPTNKEGNLRTNLGLNLGFNLAKNWKISVNGNYDFQNDEFSAPQVSIFRDLECWEMNFSWNPLGRYSGFRFEIRMKAPELRDVKVTRRGGVYNR